MNRRITVINAIKQFKIPKLYDKKHTLFYCIKQKCQNSVNALLQTRLQIIIIVIDNKSVL